MTDKERLEDIKLKFNNTIDTMLYVPYGDIEFLIEQAERVRELEDQYYNLKESAYKMQMDFIDANKHKNIYKEQNKLYREAIENIKKYNQKALKFGDYSKSEALLDISLEIMKLEGEQ